MKWQEVCEKYPNEWVLMEALESHSEGGFWIVEELSVIESYGDNGNAVWKAQIELTKKNPQRRIFFYHTFNEQIEIEELHPIFFVPMSKWQRSES